MAALPAISPPTSPALGKSASAPLLQKDGPQRKKGSAAARAAFLERQYKHSSIDARRNVSILQKQLLQDGKSADDVEFWGAKGKEGFRTYLIKKFGSIVAGWRALDRDQSGRLSFGELCNACRAMGYHGNFKKLWSELDTNGNNFVSIMEIDPEVGHYVGTYKLALMKKYGDMLTAWKKGIDTNGTGRIEEKEVVASVRALGLDLEPKKLFKMLICGPKGLGLSLAEFDPDAWNRYCSGDHQGLTMKANQDLIDDDHIKGDVPQDIAMHKGGVKGGVREFRRSLHEQDRTEHASELSRIKAAKVGLHTVEGFKKVLILRCGSLLKAWRGALDLDGNGRLTFGEFSVALQRLGLFGDIQGLWKELMELDDKKSGYLLFSVLDPDTEAKLAEMQRKLEHVYGNMLIAWLKALDVKGNGLCPEEQFNKALVEVGFPGDAKELFRILQPSRERAFLTLKDFDNRAYLAHMRGDFRMLSESESPAWGGKKPLELTFNQRQEAGHFFQIRRSWEASRRAEYAKGCRADIPEHKIDTVEEFEELCRRKFGSMTAAWRSCLDKDANGKLTFNELCAGLRRLGYAGDFKALWRHYDCDKNGHISLKEIDPEGHKRIGAFLDLLNEKYGDLEAAWKYGFNKDPHDSIDLQALQEACNVLGYEHDAGELFKNLMPMPGRVLLTIWDIDPECTRKRARGQIAYISQPKSGEAKTGSRPHFGEQTAGGGQADANTASGQDTAAGAGSPERQQMKTQLKGAHGSTVAAWRAELDPHMKGSVTFGKFLIVMEHCAFSGNIKKLWEDLTNARASATFKDIDPEAYKTITGFRELLLGKFGNLTQAWERGIDLDALGRVDEAEFLNAAEGLGIADSKRGRRLFRLLLARLGQRSLTMEDLQALLIGVPSEQAAVVWAGAGPGAGREPGLSSTSFGFTAPPGRRPAPQPALPSSPKVQVDPSSPREHAVKVVTEHHGQDIVIKSVDSFKKMLVVKYGSLFSAWRRGLDVDHNGILTQVDFAKACQFLGVKAVQKLWADIDVHKVGQISLKEIDPEVADLFAEMERCILQKFGSETKEGWKQTFDPDNKLRCDIGEWKAGCIKLGFKGKGKDSSERLFKLLRPESGRPYLTYADLWIDKDPNHFGNGPWSHGPS